MRHSAAPTIAAAHQLRIISSERDERLGIFELMQLPKPSKLPDPDSSTRNELIRHLQKTVYDGILGSFVQGLSVNRPILAT